MIPTPRTLRDHVAQLELLKRAAIDYWPEGRASVLADVESIEALQCAIDALLAAEGMPPDGRLLHIAGLVNGYHNDDHALSAAETLAAIAHVLGPPMEEARSAPPTAQSKDRELGASAPVRSPASSADAGTEPLPDKET